MASAASDAENLVFAPISLALFLSASKSSPVAPETAATWLIAESKSAEVFTAAVPSPATAREAGIIFLPAPVMVSPTCSNFFPASSIFERAVDVFAASCCSLFNSSSVSTISRCRASYLSWPSSPFSSCCFACTWASFKASSLVFVSDIASFNSFCFCVTRFVLVGSSFSSLFTSFS